MEKLREIASFAIDEMLKAGADKASCCVSRGSSDEINVDAGEFSLIRSVFNSGISMKVIKDNRKGVIKINKTDKNSIIDGAVRCVENALASVQDDALEIAELQENEAFFDGITEADRDKFFDRIQEYLDDVKKDYPKVLIEQLIADFSQSKEVFMNSSGVEFEQTCGYYSLGSMYSAHDGDKTSSFNSYGVDFVDLDKKLIDLGMQRIMYEQCEKELDAVPFEGKFVGTAVFAPSSLEDVIGTTLSNFASDSTIIDGTSPWRSKLGEKVADQKLTVSVIPLDDRIIGGERVTGDGYKSQNSDVIKDGVLQRFMLSDYASRKTGFDRFPNSSGAIEVKNGDVSYDDIIKNIDNGILVGRFSGGSPANNGDFSGVAKNSFLIENGKIKCAVTETMISGNLASMLENIKAISKETVCDGSTVYPWVAFDGVTVSGK